MTMITYLVEHDEDKDELEEEVSDGEDDEGPEVEGVLQAVGVHPGQNGVPQRDEPDKHSSNHHVPVLVEKLKKKKIITALMPRLQ